MEIEKMNLSDFYKEYDVVKTEWDFDLFKIVCVKCGSSNVEYKGKTEVGNGYYGDVDFTNFLIVKCHDCGNALAMKSEDSGSNNYCDCNE